MGTGGVPSQVPHVQPIFFCAKLAPYNQLKPDGNHPERLIFTTTKDDRVGPVHARKLAAKMEEFHKPFYYDEIVEGGHAAGANLKEQAMTWAEQHTYLTRKLMGLIQQMTQKQTPESPPPEAILFFDNL